mmetsp:Transcript_67169/g.218673  ORF Transcript_67169/g.218673 Transcript_67169/m.218673 type:complete len:262 (-) Transcript_67169:774-1559(-)
MGGRDAASTHCKWPGTPKSAAVPLPLQSFHARTVLLWRDLPRPQPCARPRTCRLGTGSAFAGCRDEHGVGGFQWFAGQAMALAHRICQFLGPRDDSSARHDAHGCSTTGGHRGRGKKTGARHHGFLDHDGALRHSYCRAHSRKLPALSPRDHVRHLLMPPQGSCRRAGTLLQDRPRQGKSCQGLFGRRPARGLGADLRDRPQLNTKFGRPPHPGGLIKDVVRRGDRHCTALQHPHGAGALRRLLAPRRSGDSGLVRLMDRG